MAHVSLYRKYRPSSFAQVVGQEHVTSTLIKAVDTESWHHAYLFTGPRGTGKTTSARLLAMALNASEGPTSTPDQNDPIVAAIREGRHPDVIEIDAASNNGVDDVRELRERVAFAPAQARNKVYIVDECHMLSNAAWNAFLKTIEEPPAHVVFVFATTEPHKVLPTVLSRTQRFDLRRIPAPKLAAHVRSICDQESVTIQDEAVADIVRAGDGSARDTLSVLDQVIAYSGDTVSSEDVANVLGSVSSVLLDRLAGLLATSDVAGVLSLVAEVADSGTDLRQFTSDAVEHLRSLLLLAAAPDAGLVEATPERISELQAQANATGPADLLRCIEALNDAKPRMRRGNTQLPLELALAKAALPGSGSDPTDLLARIDRVEAAVRNVEASGGAARTSSEHRGETETAPDSPETTTPTTPETTTPTVPTSATLSTPAATTPHPSSASVSDPGPSSDADLGAAPTGSTTDPEDTPPTVPNRPRAADSVDDSTHETATDPAPVETAGTSTGSPRPAGVEPHPANATASDEGAKPGVVPSNDEAPSPVDEDSPSKDEPVGAAPASSDDTDAVFSQIVAAWPRIIEQLGPQSKRIQAILREGTPTAVVQDRLAVRFPFSFHAEQASDRGTALAITDTIKAVTGQTVRIAPEVGEADDASPAQAGDVAHSDETAQTTDAEAEIVAGTVVGNAVGHDDAVSTVIETLGGEIISDDPGM